LRAGRGRRGSRPVQLHSRRRRDQDHDQAAALRGRGPGGDRARRWPGGGRAAGGRAGGVRGPQPADQGPADPVWLGGKQGRPLRRLRARGHPADRRAPLEAPAARHRGDPCAAGLVPVPQGPGRDQGPGPGAAAREPGPGVPRRDRPVHQACQRDQPGVLAPLPDLGQGSVAVPGPPRHVAAVSRLYRRHLRHSAARPADSRGAGTGRRRGRGPRPDHPGVRKHDRRAERADPRPGHGDRPALRRSPRPAHLRQPAPLRDHPRRDPARRDRRLPPAVPHRRRARRAGRGVPVDTAIRQAKPGRVPLVVQQETPRRRHGLRQRQPHELPCVKPRWGQRLVDLG
jgi:hypothetical protein